MSFEGVVFGGKYRLERKLGQGGMGSVWRAEHVQLRSPVAIKLIDPSIATNPEALARFMREAQSAAALRSPHVVQILDHGADHGVPYIAMELLDGESLAQRLERARRLDPRQAAIFLTHVSRAVGRAHEAGIVHRDLKPDNVYLVRNDDEEVAKVLDFGIAKAAGVSIGPSSSTRTGAVLGTPYYMSPEQAEGNRSVDFRADIWALGVIGYECIVGQRPFESEAFGSLLLAICTRPLPVPSAFAAVPAGFDAWFARCCARDPEQRFQSARDAAAELRRICGDAARPSFGSFPGVAQPQSQGSAVAAQSRVLTPGPTPSPVHPPASAPTANPYTASVGGLTQPRRNAPVVLGVAIFAIAAGVGIFGVTRLMGHGSDDSAKAAAATPPAPVQTAEALPPLPPAIPTPPPVAVTPVETATAAASSSPSGAPVVEPAPKQARQTRWVRSRQPERPAPVVAAPPVAAPAPPPAPAPAPAPAPEPPAPKPSKPRVDLGI